MDEVTGTISAEEITSDKEREVNMTDREKAIKALECCLRGNCNKHKDCAYSFADDCMGKLLGDVLELLKEQEPKPVGKEWNECPNCGKVLSSIEHIHFCGM